MNSSSVRTFKDLSLLGCVFFAAAVIYTASNYFDWALEPEGSFMMRTLDFLALVVRMGSVVFYIIAVICAVVIFFATFFCLGWSPVGALICAWLAHTRALNIAQYALLGALSSAALFVPWVYLIQRMRGKEFSDETITTGYAWAHVLLGIVIAGVSFLQIMGRFLSNSTWPYLSEGYIWEIMWLLDYFSNLWVPLLFGIPFWVISRIALVRHFQSISEEQFASNMRWRDVIIRLTPFALISVSLFALYWLTDTIFV